MQPVIKILDNSVTTVLIAIKDKEGQELPFLANRISVLNTGRSGAKDCKVYIELPDKVIRRTGWMLPDDNTALSVTLNVNIPEYVDLCAVAPRGEGRIVTNERGYRLENPDSYQKYGPEIGDIPATITVASSNAKPAVRSIILHATPIVDNNYLGRIVEFVPASPQTTETPMTKTTPKKRTVYNWLTDWMDKK